MGGEIHGSLRKPTELDFLYNNHKMSLFIYVTRNFKVFNNGNHILFCWCESQRIINRIQYNILQKLC